jgi:hypothetical protein
MVAHIQLALAAVAQVLLVEISRPMEQLLLVVLEVMLILLGVLQLQLVKM